MREANPRGSMNSGSPKFRLAYVQKSHQPDSSCMSFMASTVFAFPIGGDLEMPCHHQSGGFPSANNSFQELDETITLPTLAVYANHHIYSVMVISAAQHYIRFLSFEVPALYIAALQYNSLDMENDTHFITVKATKVLNLNHPDHRTIAFRHLGALVEYVRTLL